MARFRPALIACALSLVLNACADREAADLVERLKTRDTEELQEVTGKLIRLPNAIAVPALLQGLQSEDWRTRYVSARLLGKFQAQEAIPALIVALGDSIGGVQAKAAEALGRLDAQQATTRLIDLLDNHNEIVQVAAANALGAIATPAGLPSLCRLAASRSLQLRTAALRALGPCLDDTAAPVLSRQARELIDSALHDISPDVRIAGIVALRGADYAGAVNELLRLVTDPSAEVQHVAVQALGEITDTRHAAWHGDSRPDMGRITSVLDSVVAASTNVAVVARAGEALARIAAAGRNNDHY
ncbi:MAG: HEAT repeat domain-containing protein [bacterium]|nr:HEAT repeat domain-containing protein [bacterium]